MFKSPVYHGPLSVFAVVILMSFVLTGNVFAISIQTAELSGTTLSVEGHQAVSNAAISVDGLLGGNADNKGKYQFDVNSYNSSNCIVLYL